MHPTRDTTVQRRAFSLHFGPENDRTGAADAAGTNGKLMGGGLPRRCYSASDGNDFQFIDLSQLSSVGPTPQINRARR